MYLTLTESIEAVEQKKKRMISLPVNKWISDIVFENESVSLEQAHDILLEQATLKML